MAEAVPAARVVVIGGGHGGGSAVAFLRQLHFAGAITLIGDETLLPYHRPPLSKGWLKGEVDGDSLALRPERFYAEANIHTLLDTTVAAIDRTARELTLRDGSRVPWDHLILATGARARPLAVAGAGSHGVLTLRSAADADRLKQAITPGMRLAVVGAGYVGLEAAASARALGADVTVIEREARVLARVASPPLSAFYEACHRAHGVAFELNAEVEAFEAHDNRVTGVLLRDGRVIPCDAALVGVGAIANDELAREAGLTCEAGVVVDLEGRTSDPAIFAVGDVTFRPMPLYERMARLESVPNAVEQARRAVCAITGATPPPHEVPWFWSDQYDVRLQIAGVPFEVDELVVRGDPASNKFAVFHLLGHRVRAVEAVNATAEFIIGKKLISAGTQIVPALLRDAAVSMKSLAAAA